MMRRYDLWMAESERCRSPRRRRSPRSRRRSRTSARASSSWSSTRPTARTRAISRSRRSSRRPEAINFMATHGRGLICLCLTEERCDELGLRPMTDRQRDAVRTAFTVSIEAREGVTTGISAADRSRTIQVAIDPTKGPNDLVQPGHVFPLRARRGGVLQRAGPDRGGRRPRAARGAEPGRRRLRDHERGRDDGPRPRPDPLLPAARAQDDHGRRPDRVPAADREARRADDVGAAADRLRRLHAPSPSARC